MDSETEEEDKSSSSSMATLGDEYMEIDTKATIKRENVNEISGSEDLRSRLLKSSLKGESRPENKERDSNSKNVDIEEEMFNVTSDVDLRSRLHYLRRGDLQAEEAFTNATKNLRDTKDREYCSRERSKENDSTTSTYGDLRGNRKDDRRKRSRSRSSCDRSDKRRRSSSSGTSSSSRSRTRNSYELSTEARPSFRELAESFLAGTLVEPSSSYGQTPLARADYSDHSYQPTSEIPRAPSPPVFGKPIPYPPPAITTGPLRCGTTTGFGDISQTSDFLAAQDTNPLLSNKRQDLLDLARQIRESVTGSEVVPSRNLVLSRLVMSSELDLVYEKCCPIDFCRQRHKRRSRDDGKSVCDFFPTITHFNMQTQLSFRKEAHACVFASLLNRSSVLGKTVTAAYHPGPFTRPVPNIDLFTVNMMSKKQTGIPQYMIKETCLFCSLAMETISSESVDQGRVSAPIKISLRCMTGDSITSSVPPLQLMEETGGGELAAKLGLTTDSLGTLYLGGEPVMETCGARLERVFLDRVFKMLMSLMRQHCYTNPYDKAVLLFHDWEQVEVFTEWLKLTGEKEKFCSFFSLFGLLPDFYGTKSVPLFKKMTGFDWLDFPLGVQEKPVVLLSTLVNIIKEKGLTSLKQILEKCFQPSIASLSRLPPCSSQFTRICIISLEFVEMQGLYELSQLGACLVSKSDKKKPNLVHFSVVLPPSAGQQDTAILSSLGLVKSTGSATEYQHPSQGSRHVAVSELQALLSLFNFLREEGANKETACMLFSYSSYTTLPPLLQAVKRCGLESQFYKIFSSFSDLQHVMANMTVNPSPLLFQYGPPPLSTLASETWCESDLGSLPPGLPSDESAVVVCRLLEKCLALETEGKQNDVDSFLQKCVLSSAHLHFSKTFVAPVFPIKEQFFRKEESKWVDLRIAAASYPDVDFSKLFFLLNNETGPSLKVLSSNLSRLEMSAILENTTNDPYSLHPDKSLGHIVQPPTPLTIPTFLPGFSPNIRLCRKSSADGLLASGSNKVTTDGVELKVQGKSVYFAGMTTLTDRVKAITGPERRIQGCSDLTEFTSTNFDLLAMSIKCLRQENCASLVPVTIMVRSLWRKDQKIKLNILPWDSTILPPDNSACPSCGSSLGLHLPQDCPTLLACTCSPLLTLSEGHTRLQCRNQLLCWNCGHSGHNWTVCRLPVLTRRQRELTSVGFRFHVISPTSYSVTFRETSECEEQPCYSQEQALQKLLLYFNTCSSQIKFLIGFNILNIVHLLTKMAKGVNKVDTVRQVLSKIKGVIDIRWLFPHEMGCKKSFSELCDEVEVENQLNVLNKDPDAVLQAIVDMLRQELRLSKYNDVVFLCKKFSLDVWTSLSVDFHLLNTLININFTQSRTFFKRFRDLARKGPRSGKSISDERQPWSMSANWQKKASRMEEKEKNDESEDEADTLLNSYSKHIQKSPGLQWHTNNIFEPNGPVKYLVLSIKTFGLGEKLYLNSLSLRDLDTGASLLECEAVVPRDFYGDIPAKNSSLLCTVCGPPRSDKLILHSKNDCPTLEDCTIHPQGTTKHLRSECSEQRCWNCGEEHNWSACPKPILTERQHFFATVGYSVIKRVGGLVLSGNTFIYSREVDGTSVEKKQNCIKEEQVYDQLLKVLESKGQTILVGYNLGEQVHDLLSCCDNSILTAELTNAIAGLADLRWIPKVGDNISSLGSLASAKLSHFKLEETRHLSQCIVDILNSDNGGEALKDSLANSTLTFSASIVNIIKERNLVIMRKNSVETNLKKSKRKVVYVYLEQSSGMIEKKVTKMELQLWDPTVNKQVWNKVGLEENLHERMEVVSQLVDLSLEKDTLLICVVVCPESLGVFRHMFEDISEVSFTDVFYGWFSLASEGACLNAIWNHPSTLMIGMAMDKERLLRLHSSIASKANKRNKSNTELMTDVHQTVLSKAGNVLADDRPGSKLKKTELDGRLLNLTRDHNPVIMFIQVKVKRSSLDQYGSPVIEQIIFTDLSGSIRVHQMKGGIASFFGQLQNIYKYKQKICTDRGEKLVLISLDKESLTKVLMLGLRADLLAQFVAGVGCIEQILGARLNTGIATVKDIKQFYQSIKGDNDFSLHPQEKKIEVSKTISEHLVKESLINILDWIHPLHSPFVNDLLLSSGLKIFGEDFVPVNICNKKQIKSDPFPLIQGKLTRNLCSFDKDIELKVGKVGKTYGQRVLECQIIEINMGKNTVTLRGSNSLGSLSRFKKDFPGFIYGTIKDKTNDETVELETESNEPVDAVAIVSREESGRCFEEFYEERFGTGFKGLIDEYLQHKRRRPREAVDMDQCQEFIDHFIRLGFTNMKQVFSQLIGPVREHAGHEEALFSHLQATLCNDMPSAAEMANILFDSLYSQYVLKQEDRDRFCKPEDLRKDHFPSVYNCSLLVEKCLLEYQFHYSEVNLNETRVETFKVNRGKESNTELELEGEEWVEIIESNEKEIEVICIDEDEEEENESCENSNPTENEQNNNDGDTEDIVCNMNNNLEK